MISVERNLYGPAPLLVVEVEALIGVAALDSCWTATVILGELSNSGRIGGRAEHVKANHLDVIVGHSTKIICRPCVRCRRPPPRRNI